jgi:hypothetical protein
MTPSKVDWHTGGQYGGGNAAVAKIFAGWDVRCPVAAAGIQEVGWLATQVEGNTGTLTVGSHHRFVTG